MNSIDSDLSNPVPLSLLYPQVLSPEITTIQYFPLNGPQTLTLPRHIGITWYFLQGKKAVPQNGPRICIADMVPGWFFAFLNLRSMALKAWGWTSSQRNWIWTFGVWFTKCLKKKNLSLATKILWSVCHNISPFFIFNSLAPCSFCSTWWQNLR